MSLIVDEHRAYLSDRVRVDAFERAIRAIVRPGDVVVDLGSGTALLGMMACRAGARRVYAIEANGMIEVGRALASRNGADDRIVFIKRHSTETVLPEAADVVVADLVAGMGFEAGLFPIYADAKRFLRPGGQMIPSSITLAATAVESEVLAREVHYWSNGAASGFDLRPVLQWSLNTGYPRVIDRGQLLTDTAVRSDFDPSAGVPLLRLRGEVTIGRRGIVHGIGGWFETELSRGVLLTNSPLASERIERRNVFLPIERAVAVDPGDRVSLHVRVRPDDLLVSWDIDIHTARGVERMRHSTLDGMLLSREDLQRQNPSLAPRLTPRGLARRSVLDLCDGARPLPEIEREVYDRHRSVFASRGEAQAFVAEVIARYAELD